MKKNLIAKRYAKAFFEYSVEQKKMGAVFDDLKLISQALQLSNEFKVLLNNPAMKSSDRLSILTKSFSDHLEKITFKFISFLESKKRLNILEYICVEFEKFYSQKNKIKTIQITSSIALSDEQLNKIHNKWKKRLDHSIVSNVLIDRNLLGGLMVQVDDEIHDFTIDTKLKRFKELI